MKVFYESNLAKWLLWQGYSTITLGCFVFTKKTKEEMKTCVLNHEAIHVRQWDECMIASAILLTLVMFLTEFSVWIYLFEMEAKSNEMIDGYLDVRMPFEFARYYGKI